MKAPPPPTLAEQLVVAARHRADLVADWYAPAAEVWPDIALAPSSGLFSARTWVVRDEGGTRVDEELWAPAWAVGALRALLGADIDGWLAAEFIEWASQDDSRPAEVAAAVQDAARPNVPAVLALFRRWATAVG